MPSPDISPDHFDYASECRRLAAHLTRAKPVFVGLQHDGGRIELGLVLADAMLWVGEPRGLSADAAWALVSVVGRGAAFFPLTGWVDHRRVRDGLGLNDDLAVGVTDMLVRVGGELKRKELDARPTSA